MFQYMEELSQTEAVNVKKVIQDLFRQTCILQVKCDPVTMIQRDNPRYQVCARNREFISDYLAVLDCELVHDPQEHIFRIAGDGALTEKMNLTTTKILIILKIIYRDKIMGAGLNATVTTLREIREYGRNTNLLVKKITNQEWQEALVLLKTHQMIELPGAIGNLEDDTPIYIYSTVNIFCASVHINDLVKRYEEQGELSNVTNLDGKLRDEGEILKNESAGNRDRLENREERNPVISEEKKTAADKEVSGEAYKENIY